MLEPAPVKRGPSPVQFRFRPIVLPAMLTAPLPGSSGSVDVMFVNVALPPMLLKSSPSHSGVTPLIVTLPPIVLFFSAQGIGPPPPVSVP